MLSWHAISSSFVAINNIYNIFCFDINSPNSKVFIDFILKMSCIVIYINCMASRKLTKSKVFHSFNFFTELYTGITFCRLCRRYNPLPIYNYTTTFFTEKVSLLCTPSTYLLSLELCIPFSCCKFTLNFEWMNHKTITFSQLFHSDKNNHMMHMSALLGLSYRPKSQVSLLFRILEISTFSYTWSLKNATPWGAEPLQKGHYWE